MSHGALPIEQLAQIAKEYLDRGEDLDAIAERLKIPKFKLMYVLDQAGITLPAVKAGNNGNGNGNGKDKPAGGRILGMRRSAIKRLESRSGNGQTAEIAKLEAEEPDELQTLRAENAELSRQIELLNKTVLGFAEALADRLKQDADEVGNLIKSIRKKR